MTDQLVQKTLDLFAPNVYFALSSSTKDELRKVVTDQSAEMVTLMMTQIRDKVLSLLDLCGLVGRLAEENKSKVVQMFLEVGQKEYRFVEMSGLWFGLFFGGIQVIMYIITKHVYLVNCIRL